MAKSEPAQPLRAVITAASRGTQRDLLVALRDRLAEALDDERTQPRDLSPLTLRLKEIRADIERLDDLEADADRPELVEDGIFDPSQI